MPDHGGVEGVVLPLRLSVRGLVSCAPGGMFRVDFGSVEMILGDTPLKSVHHTTCPLNIEYV
jgi:hypothetical protein